MPLARRRGRTRNLKLSQKREAKESLTFEVDPYIRRIVGKDAQYFISESGCVVRKFAKLNVTKWSHLQDKDRDNIYNTATVRVSFSLDHYWSESTLQLLVHEVTYNFRSYFPIIQSFSLIFLFVNYCYRMTFNL